MMRLNSVLLLAVIASAMYLVQVQYQSRRLFVEVEKAQSLSRKLEIERERLEVDKRSQATPLRIEKIAKEKLQMRSATPAVTQYVKLPPELAQDQAASPIGDVSQQKATP